MALLQPSALDEFIKRPLPADWPENCRQLFSPDDDLHGAILACLGSACESIAVMMYGYDDESFDAAIREKLNDEHVAVQLSLDSTQAGGTHEKAILEQWPGADKGNLIAIGQSSKKRISHDKNAVIDGWLTISGSTNWSADGEGKQNNELIVFFSRSIAVATRAKIDKTHAEMIAQMMAAKP